MSRLFIVPPSCVLSNNTNHKNTSIQMVHYQSIPAATHHANAEQDDTVKTNKSIMVRRIVAGAVLLILCVGLGVVATTQTFRSRRSIILAGPPPLVSSPPAATATATATLLRATTTTMASAGGREECCAPAKGTWNDADLLSGPGSDPFETCYYWDGCDTTALNDLVSSCYCWSKSFWNSESNFYPNGDSWDYCPPNGSLWIIFDVQEIMQLAGQGTTSSGTFCGTPCQDFDESVQTC